MNPNYTPAHQNSLSPETIKRIEKDVQREEKTEAARVQHALKDLKHATKAENNATKAIDKAEHALAKAEKKENKTMAAQNKAIHNHDVATANVNDAAKKVELTKQREAKLAHDLAARQTQVDALEHDQKIHQQQREAKLAAVKDEAAATMSPTSPAGRTAQTNGPATNGIPNAMAGTAV